MKIVIDIPEEIVRTIRENNVGNVIYQAIKNGTPLPEGHGRLIYADAYIGKHGYYGYLEDIKIDYFNAVTPTIIDKDGEQG